jgi:hypothetical protein
MSRVSLLKSAEFGMRRGDSNREANGLSKTWAGDRMFREGEAETGRTVADWAKMN